MKYSWFTMLCQSLLYGIVTQLYTYIRSFQTPSTYLIIEISLVLFCIFLVMQMNIKSSDLGLNCCSIIELKLIQNRNVKTKEYFLFFKTIDAYGYNIFKCGEKWWVFCGMMILVDELGKESSKNCFNSYSIVIGLLKCIFREVFILERECSRLPFIPDYKR